MEKASFYRKNHVLFDSILIAFFIGAIYALFLGSYPLINPDEGRYAEIAREMLANHDWITPYLNHLLYFEKPILFYWLEASALKLFGLTEWAARLWPAILGVFGCVIIYFTAQKLYDRATGLYAAFILASSLLYFGLAHYANVDMTLTFMLSACLFSFLLGTHTPIGWQRRKYFWLAAIFAALAVLTKGLIGIVFPIAIIGLYVLLLNEWRELKHWYIPTTLLVFLLVALPWHIAIQIKHPSFAYFYFISQQFSRYATLDASRYEPFYFYSFVFLASFFPWSAFIIQALRRYWPKWRERKQYKTEIFMLCWFFLILIFFSISQSQLIPYILPVFPPAAMIVGKYFVTREKKKTLGLYVGFFIVPIVAIALVAFCMIFPKFYPLVNPTIAKIFLLGSSLWLVLITLIANQCLKSFNLRAAVIILIVGFFAFCVALLPAIQYIDHRSTKLIANIINKNFKPGDEIVAYNHYFQDLPFYVQRRITVVNWFTNELAFGIAHDKNSSQWMIDKNTFWKIFKSNQKLFVAINQWDYDAIKKEHPKLKFYELAQTQRAVLISNKPGK